MSVYQNTFVSFVSETGHYCIGRVLKLGACSLVMGPLEKCRVPSMGESGSLVINIRLSHQLPLAVTAWAQVGDSSESCIEFYFHDIDQRARELMLQIMDSLRGEDPTFQAA